MAMSNSSGGRWKHAVLYVAMGVVAARAIVTRDSEVATDQSVREQSGPDPSFALQAYSSIYAQEAHYNNLQAGVRTIASAWLLAALTALGLIGARVSDKDSFGISPTTVITAVCLFGSVGLTALWVLDQLVYQKFIGAMYVVGLNMEYRYACLPPTRTALALNARKGRGISKITRWFYLLPMLVLVVCGSYAAIAHFGQPSAQPVALGVACLNVLLFIWLFRLGGGESPRDRAKSFNDEGFTYFVDNLTRGSGNLVLKSYMLGSQQPRDLHRQLIALEGREATRRQR